MPHAAQQTDDSSNSVEPESSTDAPTSETDSTANLESIASNLAGTMPDVQEHAVNEAKQTQQATGGTATDKLGTKFDPAIHVTGSDGKPQLTVRGTFALKRGRKAGSATTAPSGKTGTTVAASGSSMPAAPSAADAQKVALAAQSRAAGEGAAEMVLMAGRVIGGDEWNPMRDEKTGLDERAMLRGAFGDYFVATNKADVPPGAVLGLALLAYIAPRFAMPKTQARFGGIKAKITQWWVNRKLRKSGLTAEVREQPAKA